MANKKITITFKDERPDVGIHSCHSIRIEDGVIQVTVDNGGYHNYTTYGYPLSDVAQYIIETA